MQTIDITLNAKEAGDLMDELVQQKGSPVAEILLPKLVAAIEAKVMENAAALDT
jgi:hypothetical protein